MVKKILWIVIILLGMAAAVFVLRNPSGNYQKTEMMMGTFVSVQACGESRDSVMNQAWKEMRNWSDKLNRYSPESLVARINANGTQRTTLDPETFALLRRAQELCAATQGAFDVSVYPLVRLWKEALSEGKIPEEDEIAKLKIFVGCGQISFYDGNQVSLETPRTEIDLSAVAKGFVVDKGAQKLRDLGVENFLIDAGGDIYASGLNCEGEKWKVGVKDPSEKNGIGDVLNLSNAAVTTSGDYEQYYEVDGKRYSHIIDPRTGYPQKEITSATVIAPKAADADALSTALCVLTSEKGMAVLNALGEEYTGQTLAIKKEVKEIPGKNRETDESSE